MGQVGAPEVDTRAIAASLHGFVSEVTGHDAQGQFRTASALEVQ